MRTNQRNKLAWKSNQAQLAVLLMALCVVSGCAHNSSESGTNSRLELQAKAGQPAPGQPVFNTDQDAANALVAAAKAHDHAKVHELLGPGWKDLVSGDKVEDTDAFNEFASRADEHMQLERHAGEPTTLIVGKDNWACPIPIVKDSQGKWFLDSEAGRRELLTRRIGANELEAMHVSHILVNAQKEYANQQRSASGSAVYAQRIISTHGQQNGLYWKAENNAPKSPLEQLVSKAKMEGYSPKPGRHGPYHGYLFHVLTSQGPNAPGGAQDYIANGKMVNGFAFIAYPVDYGASGIMTFMVDRDGKVYQKDLGPETKTQAKQIKSFNPDSTWQTARD